MDKRQRHALRMSFDRDLRLEFHGATKGGTHVQRDIRKTRAYIVGGGIAGLSSAVS